MRPVQLFFLYLSPTTMATENINFPQCRRFILVYGINYWKFVCVVCILSLIRDWLHLGIVESENSRNTHNMHTEGLIEPMKLLIVWSIFSIPLDERILRGTQMNLPTLCCSVLYSGICM